MMYQSLPYIDVWVKKSFLMGPENFKWGKDEMIKGVLVGVKATRGSLFLFEVFLPEYHASYDKVVQAGIFNKSEPPDQEIKLDDVAYWDCIAGDIEVYYKALYQTMHVQMKTKTGKMFEGQYQFTIDFRPSVPNSGVDFSQANWWSEHKQKNFFFDEDTGVLACGPNNKMRYIDESLCPAIPKKPFFKVYEQNYLSHETHSRFFGDIGKEFDYDTKKEK